MKRFASSLTPGLRTYTSGRVWNWRASLTSVIDRPDNMESDPMREIASPSAMLNGNAFPAPLRLTTGWSIPLTVIVSPPASVPRGS